VAGPFNLAQIGAVTVALIVTAGALLFATVPLGGTPANQAQPGSGFYTLGAPEQGLRIGDQAPELEGTVNGELVGLADLAGDPVRLADLRGKPVWINFFATWCPPCQQETPVLRELYEKYAPAGLALVAISVQETSIDDVRAFVQQYNLGYTVGFDGSAAIFHAYRVFGLPTHIFIDRQGVIRQVFLGPVTSEQAEPIISDLLAR
jgi:thiol-disulfide isomerase/thioredoxin